MSSIDDLRIKQGHRLVSHPDEWEGLPVTFICLGNDMIAILPPISSIEFIDVLRQVHIRVKNRPILILVANHVKKAVVVF